jgi:hypothetical protein
MHQTLSPQDHENSEHFENLFLIRTVALELQAHMQA